FQEALKLIKEENPLPAICGRVCHHPCESVCTRGQVDEPVAIDFIKRFVADLDLNSETRYLPQVKEKKEDKVAIIGAGPAGLSCAYYLAREGYRVTIYEKLPVTGGMLSVGIPEYRLPVLQDFPAPIIWPGRATASPSMRNCRLQGECSL
ncbi:MAG: FAD-dependent oxidoreductase, partial [Deltaproteobacteria bacterium]|nr:FAD-dependent oxidoreductase [Deltaproteobacteria bacterium]